MNGKYGYDFTIGLFCQYLKRSLKGSTGERPAQVHYCRSSMKLLISFILCLMPISGKLKSDPHFCHKIYMSQILQNLAGWQPPL